MSVAIANRTDLAGQTHATLFGLYNLKTEELQIFVEWIHLRSKKVKNIPIISKKSKEWVTELSIEISWWTAEDIFLQVALEVLTCRDKKQDYAFLQNHAG